MDLSYAPPFSPVWDPVLIAARKALLAAGADRRIYGGMLIRTAGRSRPTSLLAPALVEPPSLLERRIIAMTSRMPAHARLRASVAGCAAVLLFVAACEMTPRGSGPTPTEPTMADVLERKRKNKLFKMSALSQRLTKAMIDKVT